MTTSSLHKTFWLSLLAALFLSGCGGSSTPKEDNTSPTVKEDDTSPSTDPTPITYKGLQFYYTPKSASDYTLDQLTDSEFESLSRPSQLAVAHKLLSTLFYGYPLPDLARRIRQGNFLSTLRNRLDTPSEDIAALESRIRDDDHFRQYTASYHYPQAVRILTRFYAAKKLDQYFLHNWIAYILTQTILFSPAYELASTHTPNIAGVYNRLVTMLGVEGGMRYITYVHMSSEDNWRRFRSPEDNGREMLEIYLRDTDDRHVPLAGKALQNWKLNTDSDTLEVGLNRNTTPLRLFGTTVYTGDDFYRELVKSDAFVPGVTRRLVDFFFPGKSTKQREKIVTTIAKSHPETWQDILLQIVFSEEYLLHNTRPLSAEETFYSLTRIMHYRNRHNTFYEFREALESMNQATMKYKLGKLERVPLDTLSFAQYHRYIRERILIRRANPEQTNPDSWSYDGWQDDFIGFDRFAYDEKDPQSSLNSLIDYLFRSIVSRKATAAEHAFFNGHMLTKRDDRLVLNDPFNMCYRHDDPDTEARHREDGKREIAILVLDYLSRLEATYQNHEVH